MPYILSLPSPSLLFPYSSSLALSLTSSICCSPLPTFTIILTYTSHVPFLLFFCLLSSLRSCLLTLSPPFLSPSFVSSYFKHPSYLWTLYHICYLSFSSALPFTIFILTAFLSHLPILSPFLFFFLSSLFGFASNSCLPLSFLFLCLLLSLYLLYVFQSIPAPFTCYNASSLPLLPISAPVLLAIPCSSPHEQPLPSSPSHSPGLLPSPLPPSLPRATCSSFKYFLTLLALSLIFPLV